MNIQNAIKNRRSIRKYTGQVIGEEQIRLLIEAGLYAPTARNLRPTHFIVIKNPDTLKHIAQAQPNAKYCVEAGCGILVCADKDKDVDGYLAENGAAAIQNMLLAAYEIGLGTVWCGVYPREERMADFQSVCRLPENILPIGFVIAGYPAEEKELPQRFDKQYIHEEIW